MFCFQFCRYKYFNGCNSMRSLKNEIPARPSRAQHIKLRGLSLHEKPFTVNLPLFALMKFVTFVCNQCHTIEH